MEKIHTTITLDRDLLDKAKKKGINISGALNDFLRTYLEPTKSDLPQEALALKCTKCGKFIDYGFFCRERKMFLCQECQNSFDMSRCIHDKKGEHLHIRVPGFEDKNKEYLKEVEDVIKEAFPSGG